MPAPRTQLAFALTLLLRAGAASGQDARVDALARDHIAKRHIPGVAVAVVRDGKVLHAQGYGLASVELNAPATADTVFEIASLTKPFTAMAVLMLVEEGKVGLDDEVVDSLPGLPQVWRGVKVRHLLALTSGLPESWGAPGFSAHEDYTAAELVALVAGMPLAFRPGERWDYCNTNYVLLAMLIEKASGEGYGDFLARRIFRPAGMTSTRVNDTRAVIPGRAVGYERGFGRWTLRDFIAPKLSANDGGALLSTANDLARWDRILWGGALLKVASRDRLWESSTLNDGTPTGFGFGWNVGQVGGRKAVWKSGGNPGYECHMLRFVDDRLTVIALCNLFPASTARLARAIAALYLPGVAEPEESPIEDTDPETTRAIRKALADSLEGDSNPGLFDAEQRDKLRSFGPLKEFALLGRNRDGDDLVHRYRVTLGDTTLIFNFKKPPGEKTQVAGVEFP